MPRSGGTYTRTDGTRTGATVWQQARDAGVKIVAVGADTHDEDIADALTASIANDGQTPVLANLPMSTKRHTGVGDGVARTDYASAGQTQDGSLNWVDGGGTADAITATYAPVLTALIDGQLCHVRATAANATTTPTFAPNGLTAHTIVKKGGNALAAEDIAGDGHELILRYDLANTQWEFTNAGGTGNVLGPASSTDGNLAVFDGVTGKLLKDGTKSEADIVVGPASATDGAVALYDGTTGKLLKDGVILGTSSGNIPQVGTKSATEALAGLVELATQAEAEAGTDDTVAMTALKTAQAIAALASGGAFENELLHVQDQKADTTAGGTSSAGANTRVLNTVLTNEITGASLGSNQITLATGTYYIEANAPAYKPNAHQLYLYNTSDAADELVGPGAFSSTAGGGETTTFLAGRFTIAAEKVFELRHFCGTGLASQGLGIATSSGHGEVYADVRIWKVA